MWMKLALGGVLIFTSTTTFANRLARDIWTEQVLDWLPGNLCESDQYYRQCFQVSAHECLEVVTTKAVNCLSTFQHDIPEFLNQPEDGRTWGNRVSACTGNAYEMSLLRRRLDTPKCKDAGNW